jgi:hypothetical protein
VHFPVEYVSHRMLNQAIRTPSNDAVHAHPNCKCVMLSPIVSSNVARRAIPNSFGNSYSYPDPFVSIDNMREPLVNVILLRLVPMTPWLMTLIWWGHKLRHVKRDIAEALLPSDLIPLIHKFIPSALGGDIAGGD